MTPKEIETEVELAGVPPSSPLFPIKVRERKVEECQGRNSVASCQVCKYYDHCELSKQHMIDVKYTLPELQKTGAFTPPVNPWLKLGEKTTP